LAGWWVTWEEISSINQINAFSKCKEEFCVLGGFLRIIEHDLIFSKDPTKPLNEWLTIEQVAESLDKRMPE